MKKFLFLASLSLMAFTFLPKTVDAQAAQINLVSTSNSLVKDTVTNAGVKTLMASLKTTVAAIGIQVNVTSISGTLGGTLIPVASNDGINFYAAGSGSFTVTNIANQGVLFTPPLGFAYYGVQWTGTGTMSGSLTAKLVAK